MKKIIVTIFSFLLLLGLTSCNLPFFQIGSKTKTPTPTIDTPTIETPISLYTLKFITSHGKTPDIITDLHKIPTELPTLNEKGYIFEGWYYDAEYTNKVYAYDLLTKDTIIYAKWVQQTYNITFNNNGHGSKVNSINGITKLPTTLPILAEDGFIFEGWYYDQTFNKLANPNEAMTSNITLYAKWTIAKYNVKYIINNHGIQPNNLTEVTNLPTELPILTDDNYIFKGWYYDQSFTKSANPNDKITNNVTLYAKWEKKTYTISFIINNHGIQPNNITETTRIPYSLPKLTEDYYSFEGWYMDEKFTSPVESGSSINSNITLYAKWKKIAFNITFDTNGLGEELEQLENISKIPNSLKYLTHEGYQFMGWYYDEELTMIANKGDIISKDLTLYAKWEIIPEPDPTYSITFNINGHGQQLVDLIEQSNLPNPLPILSESGFNFLGWYLDNKFTYEAYPGQFITENTILYAKWQELYNITFNTNGHDNIDTIIDVTELPINLPELSDEGYNFLGWYLDSEFRVKAVQGSSINFDVTLYAKWEKLYNITYNTNGHGSIDTEYYVLSLPNDLPILNDDGYNFLGWYLDSSFNTPVVPGQNINSNVTLYAKWELITYTISYETNGISNKPNNTTNVTKIPTSLPNLTAKGYNFLGWYLDNEFKTKVIPGSTINSNITLYAKWELITYTVIFNNNNFGYKPDSLTNIVRLPQILPVLADQGYRFDGWFYDQNCTDKANPNDLLESNVTLYAKWTEITPKPSSTRFVSGGTAISITNGIGTEQTFKYSTCPAFSGVYTEITGYTSIYSTIEITFSSSHEFTICLETYVNGSRKNTGHKFYEAGNNQIFTVDLNGLLTSSSFRIFLYLDANNTVETEKSITIHSFKFIDPNNPNGDDLSPKPSYDSNTQTYTINYAESNESFNNPDRGFYNAFELEATTSGLEQLDSQELYSNNLIHLRINIGSFSSKVNGSTDLELTTAMLNDLNKLLKSIDDAGACAIIRFAYTYKAENDKEPSINMIKRHINQFVPILNKYTKMITGLEHGLVGPWGEMHSSAIATQDTWNTLFDEYLKILSPDIKLVVRQPKFIYKYYGYTIDNLENFDYENCNKIGCYNDGYLGSDTDLGTFVRGQRKKEISFLEKLETFPYGGEVVEDDEPNDWNQLSHSCQEMFRTNLSYLNIKWNYNVINRWKATPYSLNDPLYQGLSEFDYINNHLGYRFVCEQLQYKIDDSLNFSLKIKNVGFGNLYKGKTAYIILKNDNITYKFECGYYESILDQSFTITGKINLNSLSNGDYNVYFVFADNFTTTAIRGIRFANYYMYDEKLQANKLTNITI